MFPANLLLVLSQPEYVEQQLGRAICEQAKPSRSSSVRSRLAAWLGS
jgi:hypothetical protein